MSQNWNLPEDADKMPVKAEVDSPLEKFFTLLMAFHVIFSIVIGVVFLGVAPVGGLVLFFVFCLLQGAVFLCLRFLRNSISCFYILDPSAERIDYIRQIAWYRHRERFLEFSQIEAVCATGIRKRTVKESGGKWYSYIVCLTDKNGQTYEFAKESKDLQRLNSLALAIAQISGCRFLECSPEHVVKIEKSAQGVCVELIHCPITEFTGENFPFEAAYQLSNAPLIIAAFFTSSFVVVWPSFLLALIVLKLR
ncbi:MAG: hypothetical protein EOM80_15180 [Erysipelotrichia bacterium]|nr:hypothetical protein [Erysipelotrichia bacterium]